MSFYFQAGVAVPFAFSDEPSWSLSVSQEKVVPGQLIQVFLEHGLSDQNSVPSLASVQIQYQGPSNLSQLLRPYPMSRGQWQMLLAIPYRAPLGETFLRLLDQGRELQKIKIQVVDGHYPSEVLKVDPRHVSPPKKILSRIFREEALIKKLHQEWIAKQYWKSPFVLPIESKVTSPFGIRRVYNGQLKSFHGGLDLRAAVGTPIRAPASGRVVLAQDLYYSGKTVMINHGYGLVTFYGHMSQFKVKKGQEVQVKEILGQSGATGRVTGPHLHWQAYVQGEKVNPEGLLVLRD